MTLRLLRVSVCLSLIGGFVFSVPNAFAEASVSTTGDWVEVGTANDHSYYGQIESRSDETITIQQELGGLITLNRSQVVSERRIDRDAGTLTFGLVLGLPAGLNLGASYMVGNFQFGVEGFYLPHQEGVNFDFVLLINRFHNLQHGLGANIGYYRGFAQEQTSLPSSYLYYGPMYFLRFRNIGINTGMTYPFSELKYPQFFLSLGYYFDAY